MASSSHKGNFGGKFDNQEDDIVQLDSYRRKSKPVEILPRNAVQEKYVDLLHDHKKNLIVATGPAGTGKTLLATLYAIKELKAGRIKKIILIRPTVSVEEELGALPGSLLDKLAPWQIPIVEIMEDYWSMQSIEIMLEQKVIEFAAFSHIRGRTLKNAIVIGDEVQNTTPTMLKALLTRIGDDTKMIITGDLNQHDRGNQVNGLFDFLDRLKQTNSNMIGTVEFDRRHIERHPLVAEVLRIYGEE
jgi:phosphate starvation-inducible PhoH-like protein